MLINTESIKSMVYNLRKQDNEITIVSLGNLHLVFELRGPADHLSSVRRGGRSDNSITVKQHKSALLDPCMAWGCSPVEDIYYVLS